MRNTYTLGFIGLGRMGLNMVMRLQNLGITVYAYNRSREPRKEVTKHGITVADTFEDLVACLPKPRIIWLMVTAGKSIDQVLDTLAALLDRGDTIIDGGNSHYSDSIRRHDALSQKGIGFIDAGVSGGVEGARTGLCLMVGGEQKTVEKLEDLFRAFATPGGYLHVGPSGAGHYVKMVHNGVEYAILEAYADGFHLMQQAPFQLNLPAIARSWRHGSVVRSYLLELLEKAFAQDPGLTGVPGTVAGGETGRWTVEEAKQRGVTVDSIELALRKREESRQKPSFAGKIVMAIRRGYHGSDT